MARNRMIKPEFWGDEKIGRLTMGARLLFISMWNFSDDYGVISASPRRRLGESFENDESVSENDVKKWMKDIEKIGLIKKFEAQGKFWYFITKWETHQKIDRRSSRKNPEIPDVFPDSTSHSTSLHRGLGGRSEAKEKEKEKEKGKGKGKGKDQCVKKNIEQSFEIFWSETRFPKRMQDAKGSMFKKYSKLLNPKSGERKFTHEEILNASNIYAQANAKNEFSIGMRKFLDPLTIGEYVDEKFIKPKAEQSATEKNQDTLNQILGKFNEEEAKEVEIEIV